MMTQLTPIEYLSLVRCPIQELTLWNADKKSCCRNKKLNLTFQWKVTHYAFSEAVRAFCEQRLYVSGHFRTFYNEMKSLGHDIIWDVIC